MRIDKTKERLKIMTTLPMPPYARDPDQADTDPQGITPMPEPPPDMSAFRMTTISEGSVPRRAPRRALNTDIDWSQENASAEREKWRERMIIWGVGLLVAFFGGFLGIAAAQWALR